jgi:hypothetical protein
LLRSPELVSFDELSSEIRDIAYERMLKGLAAFGLTLDELDPEFATHLAAKAGEQVAREYVAMADLDPAAHLN